MGHAIFINKILINNRHKSSLDKVNLERALNEWIGFICNRHFKQKRKLHIRTKKKKLLRKLVISLLNNWNEDIHQKFWKVKSSSFTVKERGKTRVKNPRAGLTTLPIVKIANMSRHWNVAYDIKNSILLKIVKHGFTDHLWKYPRNVKKYYCPTKAFMVLCRNRVAWARGKRNKKYYETQNLINLGIYDSVAQYRQAVNNHNLFVRDENYYRHLNLERLNYQKNSVTLYFEANTQDKKKYVINRDGW
jgi:hypothetical protein